MAPNHRPIWIVADPDRVPDRQNHKKPGWTAIPSGAPYQDQPQSTLADDLNSYLGGYLLATIIDDEAEILSIGVTPDRQRQGVGKRLLQRFFDFGASRNMAKALLEVAEDNVAALELYHDFGFAEFGRRTDYYKQGNQKIDAIMMKWCRAEAFP